MGRLKTVETGGKLVSATGALRILSEEEGLLQKVEVLLLNGEINRNGWRYENLDEHRKLFAETPLLVAYKGDKIGDGHNFDEVRNPDGTVTASFMSATAERIVGWFRAEDDIRLEAIDNKTWIVGTGYIWKWYAQELVAKLRGQGRGRSEMSVSIETLIDEMHMDGDTEVYTRYQILGTTILGDDVAPAVKDASIRALSAIGMTGIRELTLRVASVHPLPTREGENDQGEDTEGSGSEDKKGKNRMNAVRIKELTPLFPGFRLVTATENSVVLCSDEGDIYRAPYSVENGEIIPGAKVAANAVVTVGEGEDAIAVPYEDVRVQDAQKIADLTEKLNAAELSAKNANETLDAMKKRENERRIEAVKNAVKARFDEVRENAECELADDACSALLTDEKIAAYAALEDKDGKFCGDIAACRDVDALCMEAVINAGKKRRENSAHRFAFDIKPEQAEKDGLDQMISNMLN